ncbi:MAG TPA: L-threonylcarbamoyladenylate synthase [Acidobacteriaceae bacterium]|nr:L-threonylcarbamoyladenylate synthase [Acidobacteriaceae bacterium]
MKTLRLLVDANDPETRSSREAIDRAAEILRGGGTVAFPTETVYGLGAHALDEEAVGRIFTAKQRPAWDPLIVHIGDPARISHLAREIPANAQRLMDVFWPGPLTLLLPKRAEVPNLVTAGLPRVGLRMPAHPVAQALLRAAAIPVAAPSANTFGRTSPTRADHVAEDLDGRIDAILDGGETTHGVESTVADVSDEGCVIYRPGVVTLEQMRAVCQGTVTLRGPDTSLDMADDNAAASPGMSVRHYAPRARLVLIEGDGEFQKVAFGDAARQCEESGQSLGLMLPDAFQMAVIGRRARVYRWGNWSDPEELAQRLYAGLRWLDAAGVSTILCPVPRGEGLAVAIRDRLLKAAAKGGS